MVRLLGAALIALLVVTAALFGPKLGWLPLAYAAPGVVSAALYWFDKRAARGGRRRVPEKWLHGVDLVGGITGGLVAQELLRHKTSKRSFMVATALIGVAHVAALAALMWVYR